MYLSCCIHTLYFQMLVFLEELLQDHFIECYICIYVGRQYILLVDGVTCYFNFFGGNVRCQTAFDASNISSVVFLSRLWIRTHPTSCKIARSFIASNKVWYDPDLGCNTKGPLVLVSSWQRIHCFQFINV